MASRAESPGAPPKAVDPLQHREEARRRAQLALYGEAHEPGLGRLPRASGELLRGALIGGSVLSACVALRVPAAEALAVMAAAVCGYALGAGLAAARTTAVQVRFYRSEVAREAKEIEEDPAGERAELLALYAAKGLRGNVLPEAVDQICSDPEILLKVMMEEELGIFSTRFPHPALQAAWDSGATVLGALPLAAAWALWPPADGGPRSLLPALLAWLSSVAAIGWARARHSLEPRLEACAVNVVVAAAAAGLSYFAGRMAADLLQK